MNIIPEINDIIVSRKPFEQLDFKNEKAKKGNCYAYALGLTYPGERQRHYFPGFTTQEWIYNNANDLKRLICMDLDNLQIPYRFEEELTSTRKENEYIIKVFLSNKTKSQPYGDFHFIRFDNKKWSHKLGWHEEPALTEITIRNQTFTGIQPDDFVIFDTNENEMYHYLPVGFFILKKP